MNKLLPRSAPALASLLVVLGGCHDGAPGPADSDFRAAPPTSTLALRSEVPLSELAIVGNDNVKLVSGVSVDDASGQRATVATGALVGDFGSYTELGLSSQDLSIVGRGPVTIGHRSTVAGSITTSGSITAASTSTVTGVQVPSASFLPDRVLDVQSVFLTTGNHIALDAIQGPVTASPNPGSYDSVHVSPSTTLYVGTGTYFMHSLVVDPGGTVEIDATGGVVLINLRDTLTIDGQVDVVGPAENVMFVYHGAATAWFAGPLRAGVFAPNGTVRLTAGTAPEYEGAYLGLSVGVDSGIRIRQRAFAGWPLIFGETAPAPLLSNALALPATCETLQKCCPGDLTPQHGTILADAMPVGQGSTCINALSGDDTVHGVFARTIVPAGDGDDTVSVGAGATIYGGPGNDLLESLGNAIVFGNQGDDRILVPGGNNIVFPGPGDDYVELGPGDDVIVINDLCEIAGGDTFLGGAGHDVVRAPVDLDELREMGVVLVDVEEVDVAADGCRSECLVQPDCSGNGVCVQNPIDGSLSCECATWATGAECSELIIPAYVPSSPPALPASPTGNEEEAARDFVNWMIRAQVGDEAAILGALDAAHANPDLRDAFIELAVNSSENRSLPIAAPALEIVACLQCMACEEALAGVVERPIPTGTKWMYGHHGEVIGTREATDAIAVASVAIAGLVYQGTRSSRIFLLDQLNNHPDHAVRRMIVRGLLDAYGDAIEPDVAASVLPSEMDELNRPR